MIEAAFSQAMAEAGLVLSGSIIADGKFHRFPVAGDKQGKTSGWYILHADGIPFGAFGNWKTGIKGTWSAKKKSDLTAAESKEQEQRIEAVRKAREEEDKAAKQAAREKAVDIWQTANPASESHFYLIRKGVKNHGLRVSKAALVVPLYDSAGILHSLHFIDSKGNKRFLSGGRIKGCYFSIGEPTNTICIAEGYATAASIYEATGYAVAAALSAVNLLPVAMSLRERYPAVKIIVCADNDINTPNNPGLNSARKAAAAVDAFLTFPECKP